VRQVGASHAPSGASFQVEQVTLQVTLQVEQVFQVKQVKSTHKGVQQMLHGFIKTPKNMTPREAKAWDKQVKRIRKEEQALEALERKDEALDAEFEKAIAAVQKKYDKLNEAMALKIAKQEGYCKAEEDNLFDLEEIIEERKEKALAQQSKGAKR
jgi:uncharacterized protein YfkK (UPF0435 family)